MLTAPMEDKAAAKAALEVLLKTEMVKARREMRVIVFLWILAGATLLAAVLLWLLAGGRDQFISRSSGYDAAVLLPGWLALTGILSAAAATVLFMIRLMRGALGNIVQKQARK